MTERELRDQDSVQPLVQYMKRLYASDMRKMVHYLKEEESAKREGRTIIKPVLHKVTLVKNTDKCNIKPVYINNSMKTICRCCSARKT